MRTLLRAIGLWASFLLLWFIFVFQVNKPEFAVGAAASVVTVVLSQITLRSMRLMFQPRLRWLVQVWRLPGMVVGDTFILLRDLAQRAGGKHVHSGFELVDFNVSGDAAHTGAQRALALLFVSMSPNSVVLYVNPDRGDMLVHYLQRAPVPPVVGKLRE